MKKQALFSLKDKSKKLKCRVLQFLNHLSTIFHSLRKTHDLRLLLLRHLLRSTLLITERFKN